MKHLGSLALGACLFVITFCASANDTIGRVGIGGVIFQKSDQIRMLKEELEISTSKIRVIYRFKNESNADIHTTVLFPTPGQFFVHPEVWSYYMDSVTTFSVTVDGKPVNTKVLRQATYKGNDITDKLRKVGFNEKQIFKTFGGYEYPTDQGITWNFSAEQKSYLLDKFGKDFFGELGEPRWKVDETFYWDQIFPAGREIEVTHEYTPFSGTQDLGTYAKDGYKYSLGGEACLDAGALAYLNKTNKAMNEKAKVKSYINRASGVEYILGTGRNWKGSIGDFTLRLIKNSPSQIVSLCFPGKSRKINPITLEFKHANFVPQDKLVVYFIGGFE